MNKVPKRIVSLSPHSRLALIANTEYSDKKTQDKAEMTCPAARTTEARVRSRGGLASVRADSAGVMAVHPPVLLSWGAASVAARGDSVSSRRGGARSGAPLTRTPRRGPSCAAPAASSAANARLPPAGPERDRNGPRSRAVTRSVDLASGVTRKARPLGERRQGPKQPSGEC